MTQHGQVAAFGERYRLSGRFKYALTTSSNETCKTARVVIGNRTRLKAIYLG
jgi:hypothetical protein